MNESVMLALAAGVGLVLGAVFFGGLWWTIRRAVLSQRPGLWFLGSLVLRMAIVLAGFYAISGGRWKRLLACLLGFVIARGLVKALTGPPAEARGLAAKEVGHAS